MHRLNAAQTAYALHASMHAPCRRFRDRVANGDRHAVQSGCAAAHNLSCGDEVWPRHHDRARFKACPDIKVVLAAGKDLAIPLTFADGTSGFL